MLFLCGKNHCPKLFSHFLLELERLSIQQFYFKASFMLSLCQQLFANTGITFWGNWMNILNQKLHQKGMVRLLSLLDPIHYISNISQLNLFCKYQSKMGYNHEFTKFCQDTLIILINFESLCIKEESEFLDLESLLIALLIVNPQKHKLSNSKIENYAKSLDRFLFESNEEFEVSNAELLNAYWLIPSILHIIESSSSESNLIIFTSLFSKIKSVNMTDIIQFTLDRIVSRCENDCKILISSISTSFKLLQFIVFISQKHPNKISNALTNTSFISDTPFQLYFLIFSNLPMEFWSSIDYKQNVFTELLEYCLNGYCKILSNISTETEDGFPFWCIKPMRLCIVQMLSLDTNRSLNGLVLDNLEIHDRLLVYSIKNKKLKRDFDQKSLNGFSESLSLV